MPPKRLGLLLGALLMNVEKMKNKIPKTTYKKVINPFDIKLLLNNPTNPTIFPICAKAPVSTKFLQQLNKKVIKINTIVKTKQAASLPQKNHARIALAKFSATKFKKNAATKPKKASVIRSKKIVLLSQAHLFKKKLKKRSYALKHSHLKKLFFMAVRIPTVKIEKTNPLPLGQELTLEAWHTSLRRIRALTRWLQTSHLSKRYKPIKSLALGNKNAAFIKKNFLLRANNKGFRRQVGFLDFSKNLISRFFASKKVQKFRGRLRQLILKRRTIVRKPKLGGFNVSSTTVYPGTVQTKGVCVSNMSSFGKFLEQYRTSITRRATAVWKTNLAHRFIRWNTYNLSYYPVQRFYTETKIHKAKAHLALRLSKEETRTRAFQRLFRRLANRWPADSLLRQHAFHSVFSAVHYRLRAFAKQLQEHKAACKRQQFSKKRYEQGLLHLVTRKLSKKKLKHLPRTRRVQYRISRFITGLICKFVSVNYSGKRSLEFKDYRTNRRAARKVAAKYVFKKKWVALPLQVSSKRAQFEHAKKHNDQVQFFKINTFKKTWDIRGPHKSFSEKTKGLVWRKLRKKIRRKARRVCQAKQTPSQTIRLPQLAALKSKLLIKPVITTAFYVAPAVKQAHTSVVSIPKIIDFKFRFFSTTSRRFTKNTPGGAQCVSNQVAKTRITKNLIKKPQSSVVKKNLRVGNRRKKVKGAVRLFYNIIRGRAYGSLRRFFYKVTKRTHATFPKNIYDYLCAVFVPRAVVAKKFVRTLRRKPKYKQTADKRLFKKNYRTLLFKKNKNYSYKVSKTRLVRWSKRQLKVSVNKARAHFKKIVLKKLQMVRKQPKTNNSYLANRNILLSLFKGLRNRAKYVRTLPISLRRTKKDLIVRAYARYIKRVLATQRKNQYRRNIMPHFSLRSSVLSRANIHRLALDLILRKRFNKKIRKSAVVARKIVKDKNRSFHRLRTLLKKIKNAKKRILQRFITSKKRKFSAATFTARVENSKKLRRIFKIRYQLTLKKNKHQVVRLFKKVKIRASRNKRASVLMKQKNKNRRVKGISKKAKRYKANKLKFYLNLRGQRALVCGFKRIRRSRTNKKTLLEEKRSGLGNKPMTSYEVRKWARFDVSQKKIDKKTQVQKHVTKRGRLQAKRRKNLKRYFAKHRKFGLVRKTKRWKKRPAVTKKKTKPARKNVLLIYKKLLGHVKQKFTKRGLLTRKRAVATRAKGRRITYDKIKKSRVRTNKRGAYKAQFLSFFREVKFKNKLRHFLFHPKSKKMTQSHHALVKLEQGLLRHSLQAQYTLLNQPKMLTAKARALRMFVYRIKRRRLLRRNYRLQNLRGARLVPLIDSTYSILNKYERDRHRGKRFARRARRKIARLKHVPQWTHKISLNNKNIAKRFPQLRRRLLGGRSFKYSSAAMLSRAQGNTAFHLSVNKSRDTFPFRHRKHPRRQDRNFGGKKTNEWLTRMFNRLQPRIRRKLSKSFRRLEYKNHVVNSKLKSRCFKTFKKLYKVTRKLAKRRRAKFLKRKAVRLYIINKGRLGARHRIRSTVDRKLLTKRYGRRRARYAARSNMWKNRGLRRKKNRQERWYRCKPWEKMSLLRRERCLKKRRAIQFFIKKFLKKKPTVNKIRLRGVSQTVVKGLRQFGAKRVLVTPRFARNVQRKALSLLLTTLPYYATHYRMAGRLRSKISRLRPNKNTYPRLRLSNKKRYLRALALYKNRQKRADAWNTTNYPFVRPVAVKREEKFRKELYKQRWYDSNDHKTFARAGVPAPFGYRRVRRVFVSAFSKNRLWKPSILPLPLFHPAIVKSWNFSRTTNEKVLKRKRQLKPLLIKLSGAITQSIKSKGIRRSGVKTYFKKNTVSRSKYRFFNNFQNHHYIANQKTHNHVLDTGSSVSHRNFKLVAAFFDRIFSDALRTNKKLRKSWQQYQKFYSVAVLFAVREMFLLRLVNYVVDTPAYRQVARWSLHAWSQFQTFLNERSNLTATEFRSAYIAKIQNEALSTNPEVLVAEFNAQLSNLIIELENFRYPRQMFTNLRTLRVAQNSASGQYSVGHQTKKALVFAALHLGEKDQRTYFLNSFEAQENDIFDLKNRVYTSVYHTWLTKMQTYLQQLQKTKSIPSMDDEQSNHSVDLGIEQPRFPAAGRRLHTFDAFLRTRYAKIAPQRFRRVLGLRYKRFRPALQNSFISRVVKTENTRALRGGRKLLLNIQFSSYFSKQERELKNRNYKNLHKRFFTAKRRFASLPTRLLTRSRMRELKKWKSALSSNHDRKAEVLLRDALCRRFFARRARDLRKASRRRRLSSVRRAQFWKRFKLARRARKAAQYNAYSLVNTHRFKRATSFQWTLSEFSVRVPRKIRKKIKYVTVPGELLNKEYIAMRRPRHRKLTAYRFSRRVQKWKRGFKLTTRQPRRLKIKTRRRRPRWWKPAQPRRELRRRMRKRYRYSYYNQTLPILASRSVLNKLENANNGFNYRLVNQTRSTVVLAPLHFRRPATFISVSSGEKKRWRLFVQASRQRRYRRLSEFSETLTSYLPQLIRQLMEKKLNGKAITKKEAASMVQSIYWNLRVYLQGDLTGNKTEMRYSSVKRLQQLRREVASNSEYRFFRLSDLRVARYRFQPHCLHRAPSLFRGAHRWLRQFLPKFYELYLEDPEKYKKLKLTPIKVFRSHINRGPVANWETRKIPGRMEDRFIKLTTERNYKNSSRFENMLMTTRRTPVIGGYGAAATLRVINSVGISTARTSFFHRFFSTTPRLFKDIDILKSVLITTRINSDVRQTTTEKKSTSDYFKATAHRATKSRIFSNAQLQGEHSSIDIRNTRLKSPRSAEYLQRLLPTENRAGRISQKNMFKERKTVTRGFRDTRKFLLIPEKARKDYSRYSSAQTRFLPQLRKLKTHRRVPATLKTVQIADGKKIIQKNLSSLLPVKRRTLLSKRAVLLSATRSPLKNKNMKKTAATKRSILHYRQAQARSPYLYFTAAPVLTHRALQLKRLSWAVLRGRQYHARLSQKLQSQEKKPVLSSLFMNRKQKKKKSIVITAKQSKVKLWLNELGYNKKQTITTNKTFSTFFLSKKKTLYTHKWNRDTKLSQLRSHFFSHAKETRHNFKLISRAANSAEKRRSFIMFTRRRNRLWGQLTLRWMKKKRLLKGWFKHVKYSFKDKSWIAAVNYALQGSKYSAEALTSDVLFKASRLRLRRLEWRERSDRFTRAGFRNAFTFHPRERGNAPWLESLMFTRSAYNFQRGEYKRDQFPREQKHKKWLQRLRKSLYRKKASHVYIRGRRWPLLRMYSQRLHRSLFQLRHSKMALKRFRKLSRRKTKTSGFEKSMSGFGDRMDVNLLLLNIAPTVFWARRMAGLGFLRVNGVEMPKATFRFKVGDYVEWAWDKIQRFQSYFVSRLKKRGYTDLFKNTSFELPGNFSYYPKLRAAHYKRLPKLTDLPESSRLNTRMFRWFQLDSGLGK